MKFPIRKIILPNNTFSKLLLTTATPQLTNFNKYKSSYGWIYKKQFNGNIGNKIIYDVLTYAKYDYNRDEPQDSCFIKTILYTNDYEYSIHENCKLEFLTIDNNIDYSHINMTYTLSDTNNDDRYGVGKYSIPTYIYKDLNMSQYFNDDMHNKFNYMNKIISKK